MSKNQTKEYFNQWRLDNKDKIYKRHKEWRERNKKLIHELSVEFRKNNKEWIKNYVNSPEQKIKNKTRDISQEKISLKDKVCEVCGTNNDLQRHHTDYSKPLEVMILCRKHHVEWHMNNKVKK